MAHEPEPRPDAVRRTRSDRARGAAHLAGGESRALTGGATQGRRQTHRPSRWRTAPGAQLPHPARRSRDAHPQCRPPRPRSPHRRPRHPHRHPAPRPRSARRHPHRVDRPTPPGLTISKPCAQKRAKFGLSNLVLDDLDKELTRRGHRFCRYADDCNIYVRSRRAGERVMASISRFLTQKLRLKVNEAKSAVARPEERKFLGFSISNDGGERRIAPQALDKFKTPVREMTRGTRGISLHQLIEDLTPCLIGWRGYFGFCQPPRVLTNLEAWIRRRLRSYLWREWQNGHNRFNELRRRGVPKFNAAVAAGSPTGFWRMSGHPAVQQALPNRYFDSIGLPRLHVSLSKLNP